MAKVNLAQKLDYALISSEIVDVYQKHAMVKLQYTKDNVFK